MSPARVPEKHKGSVLGKERCILKSPVVKQELAVNIQWLEVNKVNIQELVS